MPRPFLICSQSDYLIRVFDRNSHMTNSADPDQLASSKANWSGSTLFAKTGHVVFSKRRVKRRNEYSFEPNVRKCTVGHVRQTKIQIILRFCIRAVWLESSLGVFWKSNYFFCFVRFTKLPKLWSDCAYAQADFKLSCVNMSEDIFGPSVYNRPIIVYKRQNYLKELSTWFQAFLREHVRGYFWAECLQSTHNSIQTPKLPEGVVHVIIIDQWNQTTC